LGFWKGEICGAFGRVAIRVAIDFIRSREIDYMGRGFPCVKRIFVLDI